MLAVVRSAASTSIGAMGDSAPRSDTRDPTNVRVARTRRAIFDATEALLHEQRGALTVSDVIERSGISRGAFYAHFSGLEDLAVAMFRERFATFGPDDASRRLSGAVSSSESSRLALRGLVEHVVEHRGLYLGVASLGGGRAHETLVDLLYEQVLVTARVMPGIPPAVAPEDVARFIAAGSLGLILAWVDRDRQIVIDASAIDDMVTRLYALMPAWDRDA